MDSIGQNVIISSLIGASFYYASDIFLGKSVLKLGLLEANLLRFIYLGILSLLYLLFISKTSLFPTDASQTTDYSFILLTALGMGIGNMILLWTLQKHDASTVMSYYESFGVLIGATIGYLYFKEDLTTNNIFAIGLVMLGIFMYKESE